MRLFACLITALFFRCFSLNADIANDLGFSLKNSEEWQRKREFFQEHGYLWLKNFFSQEQTALLQSLAEEIDHEARTTLTLSQVSGRRPQEIAQNIPGSLIIVPEARDPLQVCRTEDMLSCYPELHRFIEGTLTSFIGKLLNEPYVLFKDKLNFKWPGGGAFTPHQDFPAYELFGPREHVTAMVCIDSATLENGCLQIAQNWQQALADDPSIDPEKLRAGRAVLPFVVGGKDHGSIKKDYTDKFEWLPLVASPGDVLIFTSFLPHYSEPNLSGKPRRAMFFTHNRLIEGDHRKAYYYMKRQDPDNPVFHIGTPTKARDK